MAWHGFGCALNPNELKVRTPTRSGSLGELWGTPALNPKLP